MELQLNPQHETQVREFLARHRVGLLTILFTDIVGSVDLKKHLGDYNAVLNIQRHHATVREVLRQFKEGEEIETAGDSFLIVFAKPSDSVKFALLLQARLRELADTTGCAVRDRIGLHLGEVFIEDHSGPQESKNLFGMQVDTAARVMSLAGAGQTVMTRAVFDNARQVLKGQDLPGIGELLWMSHGTYLLKGVDGPVEICEAGEVGKAPLNAPADSEKARRHAGSDGEPVLGWRPALGQSIPRTQWELTEKLGEGGFGEVWLARHKTLSDARVFKFCFRADRVRSLKREVTLFRVLKERIGEHPHVVRLLDIYFEEPPFYLEMEYVPGRDLATWAQEQGGLEKVPLATGLEIVAQVADALQAAHGCGIIHRDVKPSNILISSSASASSKPLTPSLSRSDGERVAEGRVRDAAVSQPSTPASQPSVKLTDFGIGQIVSDEVLGELTKAGFTQTLLGSTTGSASGTRLYMSPELLAGQKASPRSDIYSLGVVLYQLVIGDLTRPLAPDWGIDVANPLLRDLLSKCFCGDPLKRWPSAGSLANEIRAFEARNEQLKSEKESQARNRRRARLTAMVVGTVVLAVLMVKLVFYNFGKVSEHHSGLAFASLLRSDHGDQLARSCFPCHASESPVAIKLKSEPVTSAICLNCHKNQHTHHSPSGVEGLACIECHKLHGPRSKDASATLANSQCQSCHQQPFKSFAAGHPDFTGYPYLRRTRIIFDHVLHLEKHFQDAQHRRHAPEFCTSCHQPDAAGRGMLVKNFATTCASCHAGQIQGEGRADAPGIAVLRVPGLDARSLRERNRAIGDWPEQAEGRLTPFMQLLLAHDATNTAAIAKLAKTDWLDLLDAKPDELQAAETIGWAVKELFFDLVTKGQAAWRERLQTSLGRELSPAEFARLAGQLPPDLLHAAQAEWFPNLLTEVPTHRAGEKPAAKPAAPEPPRAAAAGAKPILPENWVKHGGWYRSRNDYTLLYRPAGHADPFLHAWLDLTASVPTNHPTPLPAVFKSLGAPSGSGPLHQVPQQ